MGLTACVLMGQLLLVDFWTKLPATQATLAITPATAVLLIAALPISTASQATSAASPAVAPSAAQTVAQETAQAVAPTVAPTQAVVQELASPALQAAVMASPVPPVVPISIALVLEVKAKVLAHPYLFTGRQRQWGQ